MIKSLRQSGHDVTSAVMKRENLHDGGRDLAGKLARTHFDIREAVELQTFGDLNPIDFADVEVDANQIADATLSLSPVELAKFDLGLVFGTSLLPASLVSTLPKMTFNLHLGISPRYRGAATLFWPFYMLEPNWAGYTVHKLTHEPDAGDVVLRGAPKLERGMRMHDVAGAATLEGLEAMVRLASHLDSGYDLSYKKQIATGKNWLASDFREPHLQVIYEKFGDSLVDMYMDGTLGFIKPPILKNL
jgi:hypothetical protein